MCVKILHEYVIEREMILIAHIHPERIDYYTRKQTQSRGNTMQSGFHFLPLMSVEYLRREQRQVYQKALYLQND